MRIPGKWLAACGLLLLAGSLTGADVPPPLAPPPQVSAADLQAKKVLIAGALGKPLGTFSTIEGVLESPPMSRPTLVVDTLDGSKLHGVVRVGLEATGLVVGNRYVLRGYETMGVFGTPRDPNLPEERDVVVRQDGTGKYFYEFWFHVTAVEKTTAPDGK